MSKAPKRFIKKVPPSGAAPVFKLTLPHRVVHSHLSHLIDTDFEIATTPEATNSWQGTIAPRRNKDRSEYTLQGWRLFAEAHRVQPGDQVSFELISPKRLVVQVISTEASKQATRLGYSGGGLDAMLDDEDSPHDLEQPAAAPEPPLPQGWEASFAARQDAGAQDLADALHPLAAIGSRSLGSRQSSSQEVRPSSHSDMPGPSAANHFTPGTPNSKSYSTPYLMEQRRDQFDAAMPAPQPTWPLTSFSPVPQLFRPGPSAADLRTPSSPQAPLKLRDGENGGWKGDAQSSPLPNQRLNMQLMNLNSTIRSLQSDLQDFESRAKRAEFEAAQMKLRYGELRMMLDRQAQSVLQAGQNLEKLTDRLASPIFLAAADESFAEKVLALQSEMFGCVDKLKTSLMRVLSVELESGSRMHSQGALN